MSILIYSIFLIIFFALFILILILLVYNKFHKKTFIFNVNEFPAFSYLHDKLNENYEYLINYSKNIIQNKQLSNVKRKSGIWVGNKADEFVKSLNDEWIYGWTNNDDWLNYLIIYKQNFMNYINDETIKQIFDPIKDCINICGFSLLKPNGIIPPHNDPETTFNKGRLAYHFNIFGDNSKININNKIMTQNPKTSLIFDSGFTHSVKNSSSERLLIYIDFNINKAKQYIYGETIKGLGLASKIGFPTINLKINYHENGIYEIENQKYGLGTSFITDNDTAEIHFINDCDFKDKKILLKIIKKINNIGNGIINAFYKGVN